MRLPLIFLAWLIVTTLAGSAVANVVLPAVLSDSMVLQRGASVPVWGTAAPGEKIIVSFRGATAQTTAANDGAWKVAIAPGAPGGPFQLTVKGANEIVIHDVLVGDVWACSGQSNMLGMRPATQPYGGAGMIHGFSMSPGKTNTPRWEIPQTFCKIGWTSALAIYAQEKVPVGLILAAVGGTGIGEWIAAEDPNPKNSGEKTKPGPLYAASLMRIQPFAIKGVLWWQGENDATLFAGSSYETKFATLIRGWRRDWSCGNFPFLYVQIQSLPKQEKDLGSAEWVRESQRRALRITNTAMIVTFDITTNGDLHPKQEPIVDRMVTMVKAVGYGQKVEWTGPLLETAMRHDEQVVLSFSHVGANLVVKGSRLKGFEMQAKETAGKGSKGPQLYLDWPYFPDWAKDRGAGFVPVEARLSADNQHVIIPANGFTPPIRIRYAFQCMPDGNLYNDAGLPASPFLTDPLP